MMKTFKEVRDLIGPSHKTKLKMPSDVRQNINEFRDILKNFERSFKNRDYEDEINAHRDIDGQISDVIVFSSSLVKSLKKFSSNVQRDLRKMEKGRKR